MEMSVGENVHGPTVWLNRLRLLATMLLVWAGLHFVLGRYVVPNGLDRPLVLVGAVDDLASGVLVLLVLVVGAAVAVVATGSQDRRTPLIVLALALAVCGYRAGTMDDWLIASHDRQGAPTSGPYLVLIGDYVLLALAFAAAHALGGLAARRNKGDTADRRTEAATGYREGAVALVITTVVAGVVMFVLTGPVTGATRHGQVCFAVALAFIAGVYVARRLTNVRQQVWYWTAPLVVGFVGLVIAAINPALALPTDYQQLNTIPAWGLARGLPVETVGVGVLAALWMLGPAPSADRRHADA